MGRTSVCIAGCNAVMLRGKFSARFAMRDEEAMIAEYLAQGGKVTKCPPGPSDNVVYRNGPRFRRSAKAQPETAPAAAPPAATEE